MAQSLMYSIVSSMGASRNRYVPVKATTVQGWATGQTGSNKDTPAHAPPDEPTTYTSLQAIETAIEPVSSLVKVEHYTDTEDTDLFSPCCFRHLMTPKKYTKSQPEELKVQA